MGKSNEEITCSRGHKTPRCFVRKRRDDLSETSHECDFHNALKFQRPLPYFFQTRFPLASRRKEWKNNNLLHTCYEAQSPDNCFVITSFGENNSPQTENLLASCFLISPRRRQKGPAFAISSPRVNRSLFLLIAAATCAADSPHRQLSFERARQMPASTPHQLRLLFSLALEINA